MAAAYVRTNGFMTPVLSFGIGLALWRWFPAWQAFGWAVLVSTTQFAMGLTAHFALNETAKIERIAAWRARLYTIAFLSVVVFSAAATIFYVPGERLNNLLLIAVLVASIATLAGMTAPDRMLTLILTLPLCVNLLVVVMLYEPYPFNFIFASLALMFIAQTFVTSTKLSGMVGNLVSLQVRNDALIETLALEKRESDVARIRAENASRAKSNFLANMSHELRTPLNAILGFSEIIRDRVFGPAAYDRYTAYASDIHISGRHLLNLINDILDLARIEAGGMKLSDEEIELSALCQEVVRLVATQADARGVSLVVEAIPDVCLFADRRAVKQILVNLAANAVKFTPQGGTVTLHQTLEDQGGLVLNVTDTGIGIADADLSRVLEKFGQARHDVSAENDKGVGLGLPIAKGLAEAHGAVMSLRSSLGVGTSVSVAFPSARTHHKQAAA